MSDHSVTKEEIAAFFEPDNSIEFEDKKLGRVAVLANQIQELEREIAEQETVVKSLKEKKRQISKGFGLATGARSRRPYKAPSYYRFHPR